MKELNNGFVNEVLEEIKLIVGSNANVLCHEVLKNNNVRLHGITIATPGENISPVIYIENFMDKDMSSRDVAKTIITQIAKKRNPVLNIKVEDIKDFDNVKHRIYCKIISREKNKELLRTIPHATFCDLAVILIIDLGKNSDGTMAVKVNENILSLWNKTFDELYPFARENTERMFPAKFRGMAEMIAEISGMPVEMDSIHDVGLYVLTNEVGMNGATCIIYPDILCRIADKIKSDFVIIPSSIHEVIIQSICPEITIEDLNQMITEVNREEVPDEDILSDHAYVYRRETKKIEF